MFKTRQYKLDKYLQMLVSVLAMLFVITLYSSSPVSAATITNQKPGAPVSLTIPDTELLVTGCVAVNSLVSVFDQGANVGAIASDSNGKYSRLLTSQTPTIHLIETIFEDPMGNKTAKTSNRIALPAKTLTTITVNPAPTVTTSPSPIDYGKNFTLQGYTCPNATVTITIDGSTVVTAIADSNGRWQISINSIDYSVGTHTYTVSSSKAGYQSVTSSTKQFLITDSQQPVIVIVNPEEIPPPNIVSPKDGAVFQGDTATIIGNSIPNAQINIYENGELIGSIFADATGNWSFEYLATSSPVTLNFEACLSGRCSLRSTDITMSFDGVASLENIELCRVDFRLVRYRFWGYRTGESVSLELETSSLQQSGTVFSISWDDDTTEIFDYDANQPNTWEHSYRSSGNYTGTITSYQSQDVDKESPCRLTRYFTVQVDTDNSTTNILNILWLLLILGFISFYVQRHYKKEELHFK